MTFSEISSKEKWAKAFTALQTEISLLREILANLREEEEALLKGKKREWRKVIQQRSQFVLQLFFLRKQREEMAGELKPSNNPKDESFEELVEVSSQIDQFIALIDRINLQNCRNETLFEEVKHKVASLYECPYPHPLHRARRSKKGTKIATYTVSGDE